MRGLYAAYKMDENLEKEGILFEVGMNSKGEPMAIRLARAGGSNTKFGKVLEFKLKPFGGAQKIENMEREAIQRVMRETYADAVVLGWENFEDQDGEPLPFSKENVVKVFSDLPELFKDVQEFAQKSAAFRAHVRDDNAGN